jgi:hypothetical protein
MVCPGFRPELLCLIRRENARISLPLNRGPLDVPLGDHVTLEEQRGPKPSTNYSLQKEMHITTNSETKQIRRVVIGHANGKSVIKSDEVLSTYHFKAIPGFGHTMIWASNGIPNLSDEPKADYPSSVIPVPGATNIQLVLFPAGYPAGPASQSAMIDHEAAAPRISRASTRLG